MSLVLSSSFSGLSRILRLGVDVCAVLAVLVFSLSAVQAQDVIAYGRNFERVTDLSMQSSIAVPVPAHEDEQADSKFSGVAADAYRLQIIELEQLAGPYADGLVEPLSALARAQRAGGDVKAALRSYQRALHLMRVNEGLYSDRQLPLVRDLLSLHREAEDFTGLDQRYEYFFRLYGGGQPPFDALRLRATLEYLRWQREALARKLEPAPYERRLLDLYALNKSVIALVNEDPDVAMEWRIALLESQMSNLYLLQEHIKPLLAESAIRPGLATTSQLYGAANPEDDDPLSNRLNVLKRTLIGKGRTLTENLIEQFPAMDAVQRGRVELLLADWYQWNFQRSRAARHYAKAYALIEASGEHELLGEWFAEPVELPDNGAFSRPAKVDASSSADDGTEMSARFLVSEKGRATDIHVSVPSEDLRGEGIRLRRQLSQMVFRPRYENAVAEPAEVTQRVYRVYDS